LGLVVHTKFPDANSYKFNFAEWNRQFVSNNVIIYGKYSAAYFKTHWTPLSIKTASKGKEYYIINKIKYAVDDSRYLITNQDTLYESLIDSETKIESFTLNFHKRFAQDVFNTLSNTDEFLLEYPEIKHRSPFSFFEKLYPHDEKITQYLCGIKTLITKPIYDIHIINEFLHIILERLFLIQFKTYRDSEKFDARKKSTRLELYRRLNTAKDYIHSNYSEKIELDDLGRISCLSPHHLLRKFKTIFGLTPHQYLTNRRLEAAADMLLNSSKPVTEICLNVGFESPSSFGNLFKNRFKMPPRCFRTTVKV
jgi:AraC-like DNA-binding protein